LKTFWTIFACCVLLDSTSLAYAQSVPPAISYQGKLTYSTGALVPDSKYQVEFAIYDSDTGGSKVWVSSPTTVYTSNGLFTTQLDDLSPRSLRT